MVEPTFDLRASPDRSVLAVVPAGGPLWIIRGTLPASDSPNRMDRRTANRRGRGGGAFGALASGHQLGRGRYPERGPRGGTHGAAPRHSPPAFYWAFALAVWGDCSFAPYAGLARGCT